MKLFLHTQTRIRILNGDQEWTGTPAEFQTLEPEYPGFPILTQAPAVIRYQTPEWKYIEDSTGQKHPDMFNALPYCDNIGAYVIEPPAIYVHPELAKNILCANAPGDTIPFTITLRTGLNADDPVKPLSAVWPIMLRQKNGLAMDNILMSFTDGVCSGAYTYNANIPLGEWNIDEQDFNTVTDEGQTFVVKLAAPCRFTIYRNL
jgi:hypothetical protein